MPKKDLVKLAKSKPVVPAPFHIKKPMWGSKKASIELAFLFNDLKNNIM